MSKYYYNKDFFETIDTEEKAYWLGFLYADGCIVEQYKNNRLKSMHLEIGLCKKDENHLHKFLNSIESNVEIKYKTNKLNGKLYESCRVAICCTKMCRDLIDKGCTPRKSLTLKFPNVDIVNANLIKHFIRGYFDGDGCISIRKNGTLELNFVGTLDMLDRISNVLLSEKIIFKTPYKIQSGNAFQIFIYGADAIERFYKYLYKDAIIFLDRKKDKFVEFYKDYNTIRKSKSGKQGVHWDKQINKWIATIYLDGKHIRLGSFINKEDAIAIRENFEILKYAD